MRILHIVNDLIRGGTEGQCARVVMGLAEMAARERGEHKRCREGNGNRDEHRVAVFRRQGFFLEPVEAVCGAVYEIKIRHLVRFSTVLAVFRLKKWILDEKIDVVHTWDAESAIFGGTAAVLAGVSLITSRRDLGQIYPEWKQFILRWMDRRAVRVVVNARSIGKYFSGQGLDEKKVCYIPNVLNLEEFDALTCTERAVREDLSADFADGHRLEENTKCGMMKDEGVGRNAEFKIQNDEEEEKEKKSLKFVCVSRMDPEKDHDCLLRAFGRGISDFRFQISEEGNFRSQISDFRKDEEGFRHQISDFEDWGPHLYLVGDGRERKRLEKLCFELKIDQNVHFLGEKSEIPSILAQMDVGVLIPKANEGLSNSILEYMAAGLPVICSDCGGNAELIQQGENGLVVPISDENAVFLALKELENAEKRRKMGKNGRKRLENEFSMEFVLRAFEKLYVF